MAPARAPLGDCTALNMTGLPSLPASGRGILTPLKAVAAIPLAATAATPSPPQPRPEAFRQAAMHAHPASASKPITPSRQSNPPHLRHSQEALLDSCDKENAGAAATSPTRSPLKRLTRRGSRMAAAAADAADAGCTGLPARAAPTNRPTAAALPSDAALLMTPSRKRSRLCPADLPASPGAAGRLAKTPRTTRRPEAGMAAGGDQTPRTPSTPRTPRTPRTPVDVYRQAQHLFHRSATPGQLVGRQAERQALMAFLRRPCFDDDAGIHIVPDAAEQHVRGALYISGVPGTGKTGLVRECVAAWTQPAPAGPDTDGAGASGAGRSDGAGTATDGRAWKVAFVNCMDVGDPKAIFAHAAAQWTGQPLSAVPVADGLPLCESLLLPGHHASAAHEKDRAQAAPTPGPARPSTAYLMVLDECDQLLTRSQDVLYKLFGWPHVPGARLVLIGIANALDMSERMLPRLKAKNAMPRHLHFRPYGSREIADIIRGRLMTLSPSARSARSTTPRGPSAVPLMQDAAIEFCARKMAGLGDLRRALDVARYALAALEKEHVARADATSGDGGGKGSLVLAAAATTSGPGTPSRTPATPRSLATPRTLVRAAMVRVGLDAPPQTPSSRTARRVLGDANGRPTPGTPTKRLLPALTDLAKPTLRQPWVSREVIDVDAVPDPAAVSDENVVDGLSRVSTPQLTTMTSAASDASDASDADGLSDADDMDISALPKVTVGHVLRVTSMTTANQSALQRLKALTLVQKSVLALLASAVWPAGEQAGVTSRADGRQQPIGLMADTSLQGRALAAGYASGRGQAPWPPARLTVRALADHYAARYQRGDVLVPLTHTEMDDVLSGLEATGLIMLQSGKGGSGSGVLHGKGGSGNAHYGMSSAGLGARERVIRLEVQASEVRMGLAGLPAVLRLWDPVAATNASAAVSASASDSASSSPSPPLSPSLAAASSPRLVRSLARPSLAATCRI